MGKAVASLKKESVKVRKLKKEDSEGTLDSDGLPAMFRSPLDLFPNLSQVGLDYVGLMTTSTSRDRERAKPCLGVLICPEIFHGLV